MEKFAFRSGIFQRALKIAAKAIILRLMRAFPGLSMSPALLQWAGQYWLADRAVPGRLRNLSVSVLSVKSLGSSASLKGVSDTQGLELLLVASVANAFLWNHRGEKPGI